MIKEDYVSYEVAKLLKEKGFSGKCVACYDNTSHTLRTIYADIVGRIEPQDWNNLTFPDICMLHLADWYRNISAPTHQMAMKWLREEHNICIAPYAAAYRYGFTIDKCDTGSNICNDDVINEELTTYEEAVDAALKCCLTELI